jgi:pimeloyl-ACP methyl ester carboxylesterase
MSHREPPRRPTDGHGDRPGSPEELKEYDMTELSHTRCGDGPTLVLLHGIGSSRQAWDPVVSALAESFDVIAVDLPGFGGSESLPETMEPHPAALAAAVAEFLDDLDVVAPHVVGNSLGGWVALEFAQHRPAASLTLLSPAGLWAENTPLYNRVSLWVSRWLTRHTGRLLSRLVAYRPGRAVVFVQTHGRPARMTVQEARNVISTMATCAGFDATLRATAARRYRAGSRIDAPVTVAFGSRDRLLLRRQSRHLDELPAGTRLATLPGCGHVPMSDDPDAVAALITASAGGGHAFRPAPVPHGRPVIPSWI